MAKVVVYLYRVYDAREDDYAVSTLMATRSKIKQIRGEIIPGTKTEIEAKHLDGGWTAKRFVERLAAEQMSRSSGEPEAGPQPCR